MPEQKLKWDEIPHTAADIEFSDCHEHTGRMFRRLIYNITNPPTGKMARINPTRDELIAEVERSLSELSKAWKLLKEEVKAKD